MKASITALLFFCLVIIGCTNMASSSASDSHLKKLNQKETKVIKKLPDAFQKKMQLPTYIPFSKYHTQSQIDHHGQIWTYTEDYLAKKGNRLTIKIINKPPKYVNSSKPDDQFTISDNIKVTYYDNQNAQVLYWNNSKNQIGYQVNFYHFGNDKKLSKDQLIKMIKSFKKLAL